jgi:hypothetical protein
LRNLKEPTASSEIKNVKVDAGTQCAVDSGWFRAGNGGEGDYAKGCSLTNRRRPKWVNCAGSTTPTTGLLSI